MRRMIGRRALSALLAAGVALGGWPAVGRAQERPDLQIEHARSSPSKPESGPDEVTISRDPSAVKSVEARHMYDPFPFEDRKDASVLTETTVGWGQWERDFLTHDTVFVAETAVKFDLSEIERGPRKRVITATLSFQEAPSRWTNGDGDPEHKSGCVARLGIATTDWASTGGLAALFPNQPWDAAVEGKKAWGVKDHVQKMVDHPDDPALHHGFVLRGWMTLDELRGEDDTSCRSMISQIKLEVTVGSGPPPVLEPIPAPPNLALEKIRGREESEWAVVRNQTPAYLVPIRNDGADADGTVVVDIATSGVLTLAEDQTLVRPGWEAAGFTCVPTPPSGGANAGLRCTGGSLKRGERTNPAILVRVTGPGYGYIHASVGVSDGPADKNPSGNDFTLGVRVY